MSTEIDINSVVGSATGMGTKLAGERLAKFNEDEVATIHQLAITLAGETDSAKSNEAKRALIKAVNKAAIREAREKKAEIDPPVVVDEVPNHAE